MQSRKAKSAKEVASTKTSAKSKGGKARKGVEETDLTTLSSVKVPSSEETFQPIRDRLAAEKSILEGLCDKWQELLLPNNGDRPELPAVLVDDARAVTGQTRLLLAGKFLQIEELIKSSSISTSKSGPEIFKDDIEGFWDLISIDVKQLHSKYENLSLLKKKAEDANKLLEQATNTAPKRKRVKKLQDPSSNIVLRRSARLAMKRANSEALMAPIDKKPEVKKRATKPLSKAKTKGVIK